MTGQRGFACRSDRCPGAESELARAALPRSRRPAPFSHAAPGRANSVRVVTLPALVDRRRTRAPRFSITLQSPRNRRRSHVVLGPPTSLVGPPGRIRRKDPPRHRPKRARQRRNRCHCMVVLLVFGVDVLACSGGFTFVVVTIASRAHGSQSPSERSARSIAHRRGSAGRAIGPWPFGLKLCPSERVPHADHGSVGGGCFTQRCVQSRCRALPGGGGVPGPRQAWHRR
mmetsp:Transcript_11416/g.44143  ORF Transcript_11416/g.44143 Transcript_11416/m.44143 type:complete len:228 (-) Transcript_11416:1164-1847(-)